MTNEELKDKLVETLGIYGIPIKHYHLIGPNDIKIKLTDDVVMNMKNESIYTCRLDKGMPFSQSIICLNLILFLLSDPQLKTSTV